MWQVTDWKQGEAAPRVIFTAEVSDEGGSVRQQRTAFTRVSAINGGCGVGASTFLKGVYNPNEVTQTK